MHVSKLIRALERAGLVERVGNPDDTRAVQLNVTARGVEVVTAAREKVIELEIDASHPWAAAGANGVWS
jgi:DNA-binding MarR family transcriptional regulator